MKKIITICLLAVSLFMAGMTIEAKTTKKKSKASSSHGRYPTFTKHYKGNIGPYDVKVTLTFYNHSYESTIDSHSWSIKGSYVYTEAGNKLSLKGGFTTLYPPTIVLDEYTPKGNLSGKWYLEGYRDASWMEGTFTNVKNGNTYQVNLEEIN